MKIVIINNEFSFTGGNELLIKNFISELLLREKEVEIISTYLNEDMKRFISNNKILHYSFNKRSKRMSFLTIKMLLITLYYKLVNIKVNNTTTKYIYFNYPANLVSFLFKKENNYWYRNEDTDLQLKYKSQKGIKLLLVKLFICLDILIVKRYINIIFISDSYNKYLCKKYNAKSRIIHYGINYTDYYKNDFIVKSKDYLQIGVYSEEKGQIRTLHALQNYLNHNNFELNLFGNSEIFKNYFDLVIKESKKFNNIKINKHIEHEKIIFEMLRHKFLIHPVNNQGGWLSALESIKCGCVLITTNKAPFAKILKKIKLINVADTLDESLALNKYNEKIAEERKNKVVNIFNWNRFTTKIINIISKN